MNSYFNNDDMKALQWGALSYDTLPKWAKDERYYNCENSGKHKNRLYILLAIILLFLA